MQSAIRHVLSTAAQEARSSFPWECCPRFSAQDYRQPLSGGYWLRQEESVVLYVPLVAFLLSILQPVAACFLQESPTS